MDIFRKTIHLRFIILLHIFVSYLFNNPSNSGAVTLTHGNVDTTLASNELVFINFYADWCRFSNLLAPIFEEAAEKVALEFTQPGQVVMGKVDCDKETDIASRFHITKYPTLKVIRNGQPLKREYRGQRSTEAFVEFIKKQLEDPIKEFHDITELKNLDSKKRIVIGFFDVKDCPEYTTFRRVATNLKDDCQFHVGFGDIVKGQLNESLGHQTNVRILYRPDETSHEDQEDYKGDLLFFTELYLWAKKRCVPLVHEIDFQNAEELVEEGLPLMILFHKKDDLESVKTFKLTCEKIRSERGRVVFVHGDGELFAHPLAHLGKTPADLPLIALDSFQHMYVFPDINRLGDPDTLQRFIEDLYTGKLHKQFHYGPLNDLFEALAARKDTDTSSGVEQQPAKYQESSSEMIAAISTEVPKSVFVRLQPSPHRYTLLRDEF